MLVVSDTSPIRALAHLDQLDLLQVLFDEVFLPPAVLVELEQPRRGFVPLDVRSVAFLRVRAPADRVVVAELSATLDRGEAEAIALAIELRADALLIDEAVGRAVAQQHGLTAVGVLGVLLRARQRGLIGVIGPLLDRLQNELGFFIGAELRAEVLRRAGE